MEKFCINCASTLRHAFSPLAISAALAVGLMLVTPVRAQTLLELYEAARGYDATYLAARALDESAPFKAAQAKASSNPYCANIPYSLIHEGSGGLCRRPKSMPEPGKLN